MKEDSSYSEHSCHIVLKDVVERNVGKSTRHPTIFASSTGKAFPTPRHSSNKCFYGRPSMSTEDGFSFQPIVALNPLPSPPSFATQFKDSEAFSTTSVATDKGMDKEYQLMENWVSQISNVSYSSSPLPFPIEAFSRAVSSPITRHGIIAIELLYRVTRLSSCFRTFKELLLTPSSLLFLRGLLKFLSHPNSAIGVYTAEVIGYLYAPADIYQWSRMLEELVIPSADPSPLPLLETSSSETISSEEVDQKLLQLLQGEVRNGPMHRGKGISSVFNSLDAHRYVLNLLEAMDESNSMSLHFEAAMRVLTIVVDATSVNILESIAKHPAFLSHSATFLRELGMRNHVVLSEALYFFQVLWHLFSVPSIFRFLWQQHEWSTAMQLFLVRVFIAEEIEPPTNDSCTKSYHALLTIWLTFRFVVQHGEMSCVATLWPELIRKTAQYNPSSLGSFLKQFGGGEGVWMVWEYVTLSLNPAFSSELRQLFINHAFDLIPSLNRIRIEEGEKDEVSTVRTKVTFLWGVIIESVILNFMATYARVEGYDILKLKSSAEKTQSYLKTWLLNHMLTASTVEAVFSEKSRFLTVYQVSEDDTLIFLQQTVMALRMYSCVRLCAALGSPCLVLRPPIVGFFELILSRWIMWAIEEPTRRSHDFRLEELHTVVESIVTLKEWDSQQALSPNLRIASLVAIHVMITQCQGLDSLPMLLEIVLSEKTAVDKEVSPASEEQPKLIDHHQGCRKDLLSVMLEALGVEESSENTVLSLGEKWFLAPLKALDFLDIWAEWIMEVWGWHQRLKELLSWEYVIIEILHCQSNAAPSPVTDIGFHMGKLCYLLADFLFKHDPLSNSNSGKTCYIIGDNNTLTLALGSIITSFTSRMFNYILPVPMTALLCSLMVLSSPEMAQNLAKLLIEAVKINVIAMDSVELSQLYSHLTATSVNRPPWPIEKLITIIQLLGSSPIKSLFSLSPGFPPKIFVSSPEGGKEMGKIFPRSNLLVTTFESILSRNNQEEGTTFPKWKSQILLEVLQELNWYPSVLLNRLGEVD